MKIELSVTKEIIDKAIDHSKKRLEFEFDRFHLDSRQRLSMIAIGTVGQLIFKEFLETNNIEFIFQLQYGQYDDYDFVINNKIIEIKTSGYMYKDEWKRLNGIYNLSQLKNARLKKYFCLVQIFINGYEKSNKLFNPRECDKAIIAGWIEIENISNHPTEPLPFGIAHLIPQNALKSLDLLFS